MHDEIRGRPGPESKGPFSAFVPTQEWRNSETLKLPESLKRHRTNTLVAYSGRNCGPFQKPHLLKY